MVKLRQQQRYDRKAVVLFILMGVQVVLLVWVHRLTSLLRAEWPHVVGAFPSRIYVIQAKQFWGPVRAIVPRRCREMDKWQTIVALPSNASNSTRLSLEQSTDEPFVSSERLEEPFAERSPTSVEIRATTPPASTTQPALTASDEQPLPRELGSVVTGHSIVVQRCNESMVFEQVGYRHQYFAMILLQDFLDHFTGGVQDTDSLQRGRIRSHYQLMVAIILCMLLKYGRVIVDSFAKVYGTQQYVQLWNEGRTMFDRALESLLMHGVSIVYTLAMQMTLCALFMTFWRHDHFIMSFYPGFGLFLYGLTLLLFCVYCVIDRWKGYMVRCGNRYIYSFWAFWLLWTVFLTVPMIGYCVYSVNFMFRVTEMHWVQKAEDEIFSLEFASASINLAKATGIFVAVAFLDALTLLGLDLDLL